MAPKVPKTTTQISEVKLPEWVNQAGEQNYNDAVTLSQTPYQGYEGPRVAGLDPQEVAASGTLANGMGVTNSALQTALQAGRTGAAYTPQNVTAGGFLSRDIGAYMDPNLKNVVDTTLQGMDRSIAGAQQQTSDQARGVGAWGGSRHGVQSGVVAAEGARAKAATEAQLRSQAFESASGRLMQDEQSALQAALANQAAGLQGAGIRMQGGALANQVGQTASDTAGRNAILQSQFGATARGINQAGIDTDYAKFMEQRDHPTEMLNMRLAALGMSPYGKAQTTTTTNPPNQSSGLLTGIGAAASILPLLFGASDRKAKKNVRRRGKLPGTDLNVYDFNYKKGYVNDNGEKVTGLMAQDVEKKLPGTSAVQTIRAENGKKIKAVNYIQAIKEARDQRSDKMTPRAPYKPRIGIGSRAA